jgi:hypothetical protein
MLMTGLWSIAVGELEFTQTDSETTALWLSIRLITN